ncbi:hypothetical protein [Streptomyces cellulosae]|uniref:hypothetical protein n=1 Tax=Streptomyces cellulosae TaxID=1968 RepID=UPI0004C904AB|nr:hypothetical protein [Streptomyces cellulosae]
MAREAGPLQRLYGNLTRMIAQQEAANGPVHTGRASLSVRIGEKPSGELAATLTRRKGCAAVTLTLRPNWSRCASCTTRL